MPNIVNFIKYWHNVVIFTLNCDEIQNDHRNYPCDKQRNRYSYSQISQVVICDHNHIPHRNVSLTSNPNPVYDLQDYDNLVNNYHIHTNNHRQSSNQPIDLNTYALAKFLVGLHDLFLVQHNNLDLTTYHHLCWLLSRP